MMNIRNFSAFASPAATTPGRAVARLAVVVLSLGGAATGAMAQYKIVGPDGSVTYTDKPPANTTARSPGTAGNGAGNANTNAGAGLPYETRQAMAKYPVVLYSAKSCAPCDSARQWLRTRGIPYAEYAVDNDASVKQLQQRFGAADMPIVTFGGQTLRGFSSADMASYADAAGYPAQARLNGYSWPAAVPLASGAAAAAPRSEAASSAPAPEPPIAPPVSKSGIQF